MRKIAIIVFFILLFTQCDKQSEEDLFFTTLVGAPNAFVLSSTYISHTPDSISMEMEVGVITSRSRDIKDLHDSVFKVFTHEFFKFSIDTVYQVQKNEDRPFSTVFMMDISGSYQNYDPFNQRLRAIRKFLYEVDSDTNTYAAFSVCSAYGYLNYYYTIYTGGHDNPFHNDWKSNTQNAFVMTYYEGGFSSIFRAMKGGVYWVDNYGPTENKSVTVLSHDKDGGKSINYGEVLDDALAKNVKINVIQLGGTYDIELYKICQKTGGFLNIISNTTIGGVMDKGTPIIGQLHRILKNNLNVYKIKFRIIRKKGLYFTSGSRVTYSLLINKKDEFGNDLIYNLLPFYVKIP